MAESDAFTLEQALKEATSLLEKQYGKADQSAAVQLATFLYGTHARDEFLREHRGEPSAVPYE